MVPYNVAFKNKTSEDVFLLVVDSIVDVIFFIDIGECFLLNFTIISTVFLVCWIWYSLYHWNLNHMKSSGIKTLNFLLRAS